MGNRCRTVVKQLASGVHEQQSSSGRTVVVGRDGAGMRPAGSGADATGATAGAASLPPVTVAEMSRLQAPSDQRCRHAEMRMSTRADRQGVCHCVEDSEPKHQHADKEAALLASPPPGQRPRRRSSWPCARPAKQGALRATESGARCLPAPAGSQRRGPAGRQFRPAPRCSPAPL